MVTEKEIKEALKQVIDPEIGIDIITLDLVRKIDIIKDKVKIIMTLTTPQCPYGFVLIDGAKEVTKKLGFKEVDVELSFDPPWEPSAELRSILGV